jgi:hypothetical protein
MAAVSVWNSGFFYFNRRIILTSSIEILQEIYRKMEYHDEHERGLFVAGIHTGERKQREFDLC